MNLETLLKELDQGLDGLNLPWHIGHIDENSDFMDVEDCAGNMIAENSCVPNYICNSPARIKKLIEIVRVYKGALENTKKKVKDMSYDPTIDIDLALYEAEQIAKGEGWTDKQ